ncbi:alkylated DNA repair protein (DNA oxidative demethylase) [Novosphingobium sp. PhB165]|uniref:DNA oxidative demethylase AlkB n=1 Tax=Novosphingobium sp. PhB165 TaxID=2485105 RepID=UPI0010458ABF|nr:DNA oxidative demethylase AlkB [Novosphingobium sp. PhB165]TCM16035.1 alkylated DNA repair protein (DNA oxidative demethylase) [Novosphingobium sp. PhB165]
MLPDLFADDHRDVQLGPGAAILGGFALDVADALIAHVRHMSALAPFRHMETRSGKHLSVAMFNCGSLGWVSDRSGYRYDAIDPETNRPWPALPPLFLDLAGRAAEALGFNGFVPDACLVNRYVPGSKLSLHQDMDERDHSAPIVSVSLGLPATFLWGGRQRSDRPARHRVVHGDVVVWGGPSRMTFHGVGELKAGDHPATGEARYNLTFRKAR